MSVNTFSANSASVLGERVNWVQCFNARDAHFDCLDQFNDDRDNHLKCERTYNVWKQYCNAGLRRVQMDERIQNKQDQQLFTVEALNAYNKDRAQKSWERPAQFSSVQ